MFCGHHTFSWVQLGPATTAFPAFFWSSSSIIGPQAERRMTQPPKELSMNRHTSIAMLFCCLAVFTCGESPTEQAEETYSYVRVLSMSRALSDSLTNGDTLSIVFEYCIADDEYSDTASYFAAIMIRSGALSWQLLDPVGSRPQPTAQRGELQIATPFSNVDMDTVHRPIMLTLCLQKLISGIPYDIALKHLMFEK